TAARAAAVEIYRGWMLKSLGVVGAVCGLVIGCASEEGDDGGPGCGDGVCSASENHTSCAVDCAASGPRCGDGICNGMETASSCANDCGSTACTPSPDSCTGETLCVSGTCVAAF